MFQSTILFSLLFIWNSFIVPPLQTATIDKHEFHISKCLIEYNEKEKAVQITMHLFIDDLEKALSEQGAEKLYICTEKEDENAEAYIYKYLQQRFKINLENEGKDYTFIGKEISEDLVAVWCYMEIENIESIEKLSIKNDVLTEIFDDQKNIIQIVGPNKKRGYFLFDKNKFEESLSF
jgi:uncharacterized pyridoxamine 5'-phosphate oxidase family protein